MAYGISHKAKFRQMKGPALKQLRVENGLTQADLAECMGCSRQKVWRLEHSIDVPRLYAAAALHVIQEVANGLARASAA